MTQNLNLALAKQGNASAIAALMNQFFQPQTITASASIAQGCLQIVLEAAQAPDETVAMAFIRQELSTWQPAGINRVQVYGKAIEPPFSTWEATILLGKRREAAEFVTALRTFQFSSVVPYQMVFSAELYHSNAVKLLLFFGLFPLAVSLFAQSRDLQQTVWLLGVYYASIWGVVLYNLIKPVWFSWIETAKCILFTVFIGIPLLLFIQQVPLFQLLYAATESRLGLLPRLVGFVLGVGVLEELCKAMPVYLFLLRPRKLTEPLTAAFYGAMSGLGFAIAEGATYSILYAMGLAEGKLDFSAYVISSTIRFVSLPLFHAILAGTVGYFMGLAAINPSRQPAIVFIGVVVAAVLHGLYDTFSGSLLGFAAIAFSILLFVSYLRSSQEMVTQLQQAEQDYQNATLIPTSNQD